MPETNVHPVDARTDERLARAIRAVGQLSMVAAFVTGAAALLALGDKVDAFVSQNTLDQRRLLLGMALVGALLAAAASLAALWRARRDNRLDAALDALTELGAFLTPLGVLSFLPLLLRWKGWKDDALALLLLTGVLVLLLEYTTRRAMQAIPRAVVVVLAAAGEWWVRLVSRVPARLQKAAPLIFVCVAGLCYAIYASHFTLLHHERLKTACYDLGQYDNLFFNALHGHPFRIASIGGEKDFAALRGHAELGMYTLLPFYAIKPGPEALLVLQAALLGSGAIALFLFASRFVSATLSLVLAVTYLLYAPMHRANFYDFHMQPIAAVFIMWMLAFMVREKWVAFGIAFVCALTIREDVSIGLTVLGAFLVVTGHRTRLGMLVMVVSGCYFLTLKFFVMPRFGEWWFADIYKGLQIPGREGYGPVMETLASNPAFVFKTLLTPEKLHYALIVLVPLAFLPLRKPALALSIIPGAFFTVLTSGYAPTVSPNFQYNMVWVPYVFPAAAVALRQLGGDGGVPGQIRADGRAARVAAAAALLFGSLVTSYHFGAILQHHTFVGGFTPIAFDISDAERAKVDGLRQLVMQIPAEASVAATDHLAPHVSTRTSVYCYRRATGGAEYIVYDPGDARPKARENTRSLLGSGQFGLIDERAGIFLLRRGADPSRNADILGRL